MDDVRRLLHVQMSKYVFQDGKCNQGNLMLMLRTLKTVHEKEILKPILMNVIQTRDDETQRLLSLPYSSILRW